MKIAVIGGAGYIGSHTIIELYKAGHSVVAVDNLVNSCDESLRRVAEIVGQPIPFRKSHPNLPLGLHRGNLYRPVPHSERRMDQCRHLQWTHGFPELGCADSLERNCLERNQGLPGTASQRTRGRLNFKVTIGFTWN